MINVGFCSQDGKVIDSHFANCPAIYIYSISEMNYEETGRILFFDDEERIADEGEDDRVENRIKALKDCTIVYCTQIGGPAAARLIQAKIHPLKVRERSPIEEEVARLCQMLNTNPPPWLRKQSLKSLSNACDGKHCKDSSKRG